MGFDKKLASLFSKKKNRKKKNNNPSRCSSKGSIVAPNLAAVEILLLKVSKHSIVTTLNPAVVNILQRMN